MLMVFVIPYLRIRLKSKESKEIDSAEEGKLVDRIDQLFAYVIAGSIGFERVAVLAIGLVRKGAVNDSQYRIFVYSFTS